MSKNNNLYHYLSAITLVIILSLGIYTKDFWIDTSYHGVRTGEAFGEIKFKNTIIDSLVQVGDENRFLITGDILNESYSFVGYSKDINNNQTPIIISDTLFHNALYLKGKSLIVGFSDNYAFVSDQNHSSLSLSETFFRQNLSRRFSIIILLICTLLFLFFYFNTTSSSVSKLLYTSIKYITLPSLAFALIMIVFMLISWIKFFKGGEEYNYSNDYKKCEILVDSFNVGRAYHTTWKKGANSNRTFLGYNGEAYSRKLLNYKVKIDVNEIMLLTDTLDKPLTNTYIVWYNYKTQKAFLANYMEQDTIPTLATRLYNHLFSKVMILFYIGIAMYGAIFIIIKSKT